jgi:hypothetical protein
VYARRHAQPFQDRAEKLSVSCRFERFGRVDFTALSRHTLCVGTLDCGRGRDKLRTNNDNVEQILTQLTAARWHLDQAAGGEADAVRRNIETARRTYDHILQLLLGAALSADEQRRVRRELAELRYRLQAIEDK